MARSLKMGLVDKHAIKSMVSEGVSVKKISELLKRGIPTINKYIEEELGGYPQDVNMKEAKHQLNENLDPNIINGAINSLVKGGIYKDEARELVERTAKQVTVPLESADQLYKFCVNNTNVRNVMQTKSVGGRKGVAVMTAAASERLDSKKSRFISKDPKDHIYRQ